MYHIEKIRKFYIWSCLNKIKLIAFFIYAFDQYESNLFVKKIWVPLHIFFSKNRPEVQATLQKYPTVFLIAKGWASDDVWCSCVFVFIGLVCMLSYLQIPFEKNEINIQHDEVWLWRVRHGVARRGGAEAGMRIGKAWFDSWHNLTA